LKLGVLIARMDPLSEMIEVACGAAIRKAMNVTDLTSRRLLTVKEVAVYLAVSEREVYNMLSKNELRSVRHGRRLMVDLRDLERWIEGNKF
jgi:excisionase family DNA binding protein